MSRLVVHQVGNLRVEGFSLAGEETVLIVPELNVCFDPGRAPREIIAIDNVCLTHGHMDHAAGVAYYFSQRNFVGIAPGRVIIHRELAQSIQRLMAIWAEIEGHPSPGEVYGVRPLEDVELRRDLLLRPFAVNHDRCSLGYSVIERRHKLKAELVGKTGPELVALKRQGVTIEEWHEITLVTCSGDTALGRWLEHPFVQRSEILLVECSFVDEEDMKRARHGRHIHVRDLPTILEAVPDARVMLTHLSRRTDLWKAKDAVQRLIGKAGMERVLFLMERPSRGRERPPRETVLTEKKLPP
jgi:ribonuclease Z